MAVSSTSSPSSAAVAGCCHVCRKANVKLLRCSKCRGAERYCSVACQRRDYKRHKKHCRAAAAWTELQSLWAQTSVDEAQKQYHQASDWIRQEEEQTIANKKKSKGAKPKVSKIASDVAVSPAAAATTTTTIHKKMPAAEPSSLPLFPVVEPAVPQASTTPWSDWRIHVTHLAHVSCFQVQLRASMSSDDDDDECLRELLEAAASSTMADNLFSCRQYGGSNDDNETSTRVKLQYHPQKAATQSPLELVTFDLPVPAIALGRDGSMNVVSVVAVEEDGGRRMVVWSLRISYSHPHQPRKDGAAVVVDCSSLEDPLWARRDDAGDTSCTLQELGTVTCRMCQADHETMRQRKAHSATLLSVFARQEEECSLDDDDDDNNLVSFRHLPTGHWQDMAEYLSCGDDNDLFGVRNTALFPTATNDAGAVSSTESNNIGWNAGYWSCPATLLNEQSMFLLKLQSDDEALSSWRPSILASTFITRSMVRQVVCSRCCALLGYCSSNSRTDDNGRVSEVTATVHLLRAALSTPASFLTKSAPPAALARVPPLVFWVHELIHVAETLGIFTLVLRAGSTKHHHQQQQLWIRLWQWKDSHEAVNAETTASTHNLPHVPLKWHRVAKLVYQEQDASATSDDTALPLGWTDWCCPPPSASRRAANNIDRQPADEPEKGDNNQMSMTMYARVESWDYQSVLQDLKRRWNVLSTASESTAAMAKMTFWAQTGDQLSDSACQTRTAGVAHVPLA